MNKKEKLIKAAKTIGIVAIIALAIWYFDSRSSKQASIRENTYYSLCYFSEEIGSIASNAEDARWSENYSTMEEALYDIQKRCEDLQKQIDKVAEQNEIKEPDYDEAGRRSWFY